MQATYVYKYVPTFAIVTGILTVTSETRTTQRYIRMTDDNGIVSSVPEKAGNADYDRLMKLVVGGKLTITDPPA